MFEKNLMLLSTLASRVGLPHSELCHDHSVVHNDTTPWMMNDTLDNVTDISSSSSNAGRSSSRDNGGSRWRRSGLMRLWVGLQTVVCGQSDASQQIINKRPSTDNIRLSQLYNTVLHFGSVNIILIINADCGCGWLLNRRYC